MLQHNTLARKSSARFAPRDPGHDMALAATLVFFGVIPIMLICGVMLAQILTAH